MSLTDGLNVASADQQSFEWFEAKLGIPSASEMYRVNSFLKRASKNGTKGDSSAARERYKLEIATEIITRCPTEHFVSKAMDRGTELEPLARAEYRFVNDVEGEETGFILHPTLRMGASPDLLLEEGGAEFKCPEVMTHMEYLRAYGAAKNNGLSDQEIAYMVIPEEYLYQVHTNIICCKRQWWDWCSFVPPDPDRVILPPDLRLLQIRVYRDEEWVTKIEEGVKQFNEEVLELVTSLQKAIGKHKERPVEQHGYDSAKTFIENAAFLDDITITP